MTTRTPLTVLVGDDDMHFSIPGACAVFNLDTLVAHRNLTVDLVPGPCQHPAFRDPGRFVADDEWRARFEHGWPI